MSIEAVKLLVAEMEYVLSCINEDKIPFDGDDFHEALRLGRQAIEQQQERCVGCEACIESACGREDCPKGWKESASVAYIRGLEDGMRQAIEQSSKQEPVIDKSAAIRIATSLGWTPQRQWVGLTDEEIDLLEELYAPPVHPDFVNDADHCFELIRHVEAKLKEKNT